MTAELSEVLAEARALLASIGDAQVRDFVAGLADDMPGRQLTPTTLPCARYLAESLGAAALRTRPLLRALDRAASQLHWGQTYSAADLPQAFLDNYGWVELFGTRGHFEDDQLAGGILVLGPDTHYPDHHHLAEEIYVPLTDGSLWRKGDGDFVPRDAGEAIHHPSNVNHAMRTGSAPLVAFYLWRGGPLAAKSTLTS